MSTDDPYKFAEVLKSDHFGIEISLKPVRTETILSLKSDHFGIEMALFDKEGLCLVNVKIRPFWD